MFQTSASCIKLHAVVVLELLLSEQCPLLQVCTWMGQIQRTHLTASYTLYNCVTKNKKQKKKHPFFFLSHNGKMLKYLEKYRYIGQSLIMWIVPK